MHALSPAFESLFDQGVLLMGTGDAAGAEAAFRQALQLAPYLVEAHVNLGLLLGQGQRFAEAEQHYRTALDLNPGQMQAYLNFGAMLAAQKRFAEAEVIYRQALTLDPQSPGALSNMGVLLACMKRESEAEQCYRAAMAIAPDYRKAPFNLAYLLLRQGRFDEGWAALEARDSYARLEDYFKFPRWQGEPLRGKSLLVGFEAGQGDMIQFCRYASSVKDSGAVRVSIVCHPGLKVLFTRLSGVDEVFAFDEPVPAVGWDFWTPPLSLPFLFRTRVDTIPAELPYLHADAERIRHCARLTGVSGRKLRVGLAWKGNPRFENDSDRSLPSLDVLTPLGEVADACFFSLQKGAGEDEAKRSNELLALTDLSSHIEDFADTAAIVMNLDLIITVDTAVAHLAGALGKPCWVLLPDYKTDWRWLTDRDDSPWYPKTMRLFRQKQAGNWTTVIADVKTALRGLIAASGNAT
jgi:hypothetical protein